MNEALAVVAVVMALALFVPAALFASGKWRPGADRQEQPSQDLARREPDGLDNPQGDPPTHTVERVHDTRVTNVALTWIKKTITGGGQAEGRTPDAITAGSDDDAGAGLDDEPDAHDGAPAAWVDAEVVRPDQPPAPTTRVGRIVRRALPWLGRQDASQRPNTIPLGPVTPSQPAPGLDPAGTSEGLPPSPAGLDVHVDVERDQPATPTSTAVIDRPTLAGNAPVTGQPLTTTPTPVVLEGVDMSEAPLVPSGDGTAVRIPTAGQLRSALATGGFRRLIAWMRAFRRASSNNLAEANEIHARALLLARRSRNAYAQALQAFQAVQADQLDRQTINQVWQMLERTQAEAAAAAHVTRWTAALVVAAGGQQPAAAAAVATLQRNHGGTAAAIAAAPVAPVPNLQFYRQ